MDTMQSFLQSLKLDVAAGQERRGASRSRSSGWSCVA
jgi:hypothetical protein